MAARVELCGLVPAQARSCHAAAGLPSTRMSGGTAWYPPCLTSRSAALYQEPPAPALYHQEEGSPGPSLLAGWEGG